jgi:predicted NodU family carbamoyl transferase
VIYVGTARARLGPAAALIDTARQTVAACEENRLTRAVDTGTSDPPSLALAELLRFLGCDAADIVQSAAVDDDIDARRAHAAYAFQASGFDDAVVLVCDANQPRGWGAWQFRHSDGGVPPPAAEFNGDIPDYPIAASYSQLTDKLGFRAMRDEHLVEALARAGHADAAATQRRLGDDLLALLGRIRAVTPSRAICLTGGLFFNTYFTTLAASAGAFERTYVPPHPGRNGTAVGAALMIARRTSAAEALDLQVGSPYLGPSYTDVEIKGTLENCKLSFDLLHEDRLIDDVMHALSRGRLIGWYHGRLEWGPRALGHRSVLADPFAPHVLENLNGFLKRRPSYRAYGVSVPLQELSRYFEGAGGAAPAASPFMQFEYRPRDPEKFRSILPEGVRTLRVHTVAEGEPRFLRLLQLWGEKTGVPILVNTSFNGFHEPLVCSPRDAIRVFYGTGLDVLALEDFHLRK